MDKNGPIIVIEDDKDDQFILNEIFNTLKYNNEIIFFTDGKDALEYLSGKDKNPFLILSDVNMPKTSGFELRTKIYENKELALKCVPFLFFTTGTNKTAVVDAYSMSVQGFFIKPAGFKELEDTIRKIIEYWKECIAPSDFSE